MNAENRNSIGAEANDAYSGIIEIACPSCGKKCYGNSPPAPKTSADMTASDGACLNCGAKFTIRRDIDNTIHIHLVASIIESNRAVEVQLEPQAALIGLGSDLPPDLSLDHVAKRASKAQKLFSFHHVDTFRGLGGPDIDYENYSSDKLLSALLTFPENTYVIGITNKNISDSCIPVRILEQNRGIKAIISLVPYNRPTSPTDLSLEEYIISRIVAIVAFATYILVLIGHGKIEGKDLDQLLSDPGKEVLDLHHDETRGCLFDISQGNRNSVQHCSICASCRNKLEDAPIGISRLAAIDSLLINIKKPTVFGTLTAILNEPLLSFFFGGLIVSATVNVATSMIDDNHQVIIVSVLLALAAIIFIVKYIHDFMRLQR